MVARTDNSLAEMKASAMAQMTANPSAAQWVEEMDDSMVVGMVQLLVDASAEPMEV